MSKQAFEKKLEALETLRSNPPGAIKVDQLRKALEDPNNYLVSKAAAIIADFGISEMIPDLLIAFDRFFINPVKSDPQCWAKNAIARALKELGCNDAEVFLRGLNHFQLEPVWGGQSDSATTLRGTCALALVACPLPDLTILTFLANLLADPAKPVRLDAAIAVAQLSRPEGGPVLRLKVLLGDPEPEVIGQCFKSLLRLDSRESLPFVANFLKLSDESVQIEAVAALAESREPEAISLLKGLWEDRLSADLRRAVLISLGASPLSEVGDFLLSIVAGDSNENSLNALSALAASRFCAVMRDQIAAVVERKNSPNLTRLFQQEFPRSDGA